MDLPTKRRKKQGRVARKPRRDNRKSRYDADYTGDDERHNAAFEAYYREQRIVAPEEYEELLRTLATPLPTSFRICKMDRYRRHIQRRLRGDMRDLFLRVKQTGGGEEEKGLGIKPPQPLSWYPEELAWTVSAPRQMLRRDNVLAPFHKFLVEMNDLGAINRQEAVSMIPPLLLDVGPGHTVIDMCAAPGSKTAQILETVSNGVSGGGKLERGGVVIANDAELRRCWMLSHQLKRFASAELVVTHHEAQRFPKVMMFDRVLCDVPCTGDGTMRKAPDIWRRWTPDMGIGIHRLQRAILERGVDLLRGGGRLVYSTCSMNPMENEAVVAHALRVYGEDLELVDVRDELPELKRREGLRRWKVKDNSSKAQAVENGDSKEGEGEERGGWFERFEEVPMRRRKKIVRSLFPPSKEEVESGKFPLERCMRLVPHDQDTGGFFVAVFVKRKDARIHRRLRRIEERARESEESRDEDRRNVGEKGGEDGEVGNGVEGQAREDGVEGKKGGGRKGTRLITDDPLVSVKRVNGGMLGRVIEYFSMDKRIAERCLMTRGSDGERFKRVVGVSWGVRGLLDYMMGGVEGEGTEKVLRVVNAGVRVLERTDRRDCEVPFRIIEEGVDLMREIMGKRVVRTGKVEEVRKLVEEEKVAIDGIECGELREGLKVLGSGSVVVELRDKEKDKLVERVVVWKGRENVAAVMPREKVVAVAERLKTHNGEGGPSGKDTCRVESVGEGP